MQRAIEDLVQEMGPRLLAILWWLILCANTYSLWRNGDLRVFVRLLGAVLVVMAMLAPSAMWPMTVAGIALYVAGSCFFRQSGLGEKALGSGRLLLVLVASSYAVLMLGLLVKRPINVRATRREENSVKAVAAQVLRAAAQRDMDAMWAVSCHDGLQRDIFTRGLLSLLDRTPVYPPYEVQSVTWRSTEIAVVKCLAHTTVQGAAKRPEIRLFGFLQVPGNRENLGTKKFTKLYLLLRKRNGKWRLPLDSP